MVGILANTCCQIPGYTDSAHTSSLPFLNIWGVWDTIWYLKIAHEGYSSAPPGAGFNDYAFFPLYPLLIAALGFLTRDNFIAGLIISNVALLLASIVFYKLVLLDFDKKIAKMATLFLFIFPTSFFFSAVYTESLFLLLSVFCFYLARKQKWLFSSLVGMLAALTRPVGFLLFVPVVIEYLRSINFNLKRILSPKFVIRHSSFALIPAGLLAFMTYLYFHTGDFFAHIHVQQAWGHYLANPFLELVNLFKVNWFWQAINLAIVLLVLGLTSAAFFIKKIPKSYPIYSLLLILLTLMSGGDVLKQSSARLLTVAFPIFIILGLLCQKPKFQMVLIPASFVTLAAGMFFWSLGWPII